MSLTEAEVRAQQNATPEGQLLLRMGREYYDTESSARQVAAFAAKEIAALQGEVIRLQGEVVDRNARALEGDKAAAAFLNEFNRAEALQARVAELEQASLDIGGIGGSQDNATPVRALQLIADLRKTIKDLEATQAICHCGGLVKDHTVNDSHYPVEMREPCDAERLLQEAFDKGYLKDKVTSDASQLESRVAALLTKP